MKVTLGGLSNIKDVIHNRDEVCGKLRNQSRYEERGKGVSSGKFGFRSREWKVGKGKREWKVGEGETGMGEEGRERRERGRGGEGERG